MGGQAKINRRAAFAPHLIDEWEAEDCVNFAVGLVRLTGWLLEVDWWSPETDRSESVALDRLRPIRVHVADNAEKIFDVRGVRSLVDYKDAILARRYPSSFGGVDTRYYDEAELASLPLKMQPDEIKVVRAIETIKANVNFLSAISIRTPPCIPAHEAARFTLGRCAPFAEMMREQTGLESTGLLAVRFVPHFAGNQLGYFHSVVLHSDGMAEDAWGKASLEDIARRFGVVEFKVSREEHRDVVLRLKQNSRDQYEAAERNARELIKLYRPSILGLRSGNAEGL